MKIHTNAKNYAILMNGGKMNIKEVIVVEGKHDTAVLQQYFQVDTIETNGSAINKETLQLIRAVQSTRGVIIFTDPDFPGRKIRTTIQEAVDGCKHAFLDVKKARGKHKVGIEHASKEDLWEALCAVVTCTKTSSQSITMQDLMELGLCGQADSAHKRAQLCAKLHIAPCNAKTLAKWLSYMDLQPETIVPLVEEQL